MMDPLFSCDFSRDELAVLADLLELSAFPGVDPEVPAPDQAKAAAARGLLARGVVVADSAAGTVALAQPYATMIWLVVHAERAESRSPGADNGLDIRYCGDGVDVWITADDGPLVTWVVSRTSPDGVAGTGVVAERQGDRISLVGQSSREAAAPGDET